MPATYKTADRFRGPVAGEHGYTLVSVRLSDGERSLWPGKAIAEVSVLSLRVYLA
jgi:hypothetical protein